MSNIYVDSETRSHMLLGNAISLLIPFNISAVITNNLYYGTGVHILKLQQILHSRCVVKHVRHVTAQGVIGYFQTRLEIC